MISYEKRCIFIHIPKCGGTSIENALWPRPEDRCERNLWWGFVSKYHNKYQTGGLQHLLARQVRQEVGVETFEAFYKFCFVRDPWDRLASQFAYMQDRPDLMDFIGMSPDTEFKAYLGLIQKIEHVQWMPQHCFLLDHDGKLLVDRVGRLEDFQSDANDILERLGLAGSLKLGHDNRSKRLPTSHYFADAEAVEMVADIYAEDIELLGYQYVHLNG